MIEATEHITYTVKCDLCGYRTRARPDGFGTVEKARADAITRGWALGDKDLCPFCVPTLEPCS